IDWFVKEIARIVEVRLSEVFGVRAYCRTGAGLNNGMVVALCCQSELQSQIAFEFFQSNRVVLQQDAEQGYFRFRRQPPLQARVPPETQRLAGQQMRVLQSDALAHLGNRMGIESEPALGLDSIMRWRWRSRQGCPACRQPFIDEPTQMRA